MYMYMYMYMYIYVYVYIFPPVQAGDVSLGVVSVEILKAWVRLPRVNILGEKKGPI